jgi:hypothetical protein
MLLVKPLVQLLVLLHSILMHLLGVTCNLADLRDW